MLSALLVPPGHGVITTNRLSLSSSSFLTDPPTFTLFGDTSGGPPTTYTWTRNDQVISNNASYNISIHAQVNNTSVRMSSQYRSILTVTGRLPGVYQYSVTNRATSAMITNSTTIEGIQMHNLQYIIIMTMQLLIM